MSAATRRIRARLVEVSAQAGWAAFAAAAARDVVGGGAGTVAINWPVASVLDRRCPAPRSRGTTPASATRGLVVSGAMAAITSSFRRASANRSAYDRVRPPDDGTLPGRGSRHTGLARQHGVDQSFVEIGRVLPRSQLDRHLAWIADELPNAPVGV